MKKISFMFFIALFAMGCSRTGSQTQVQSAQDVASSSDASQGSESEDEGLYEERRVEENLALEGLDIGSVSSDDNDGSVETSSDDHDAVDIEDTSWVDGLVGESWQSAENLRVYLAALEIGDFGDGTVAPLAHFRRGSRDVVIAWPVLSSEGDLEGSTVYGVCVEEDEDGSLKACSERWIVNEVTSANAALEQALGGSDYEVVSDQTSAPLESLGARLTELGNAFVAAAADNDRDDLFQTAQEFMLMLPVQDVAFTNALPELLVAAARSSKSFSAMKTEVGDLLASITCKIDGDMYEVTLLSLTAEQVDDSSDEWRIVDYW